MYVLLDGNVDIEGDVVWKGVKLKEIPSSSKIKKEVIKGFE